MKLNKDELEPTEDGFPLQVCKLSCGKYGVLLPRPTGKVPYLAFNYKNTAKVANYY